jgi:hypothetical protein
VGAHQVLLLRRDLFEDDPALCLAGACISFETDEEIAQVVGRGEPGRYNDRMQPTGQYFLLPHWPRDACTHGGILEKSTRVTNPCQTEDERELGFPSLESGGGTKFEPEWRLTQCERLHRSEVRRRRTSSNAMKLRYRGGGGI